MEQVGIAKDHERDALRCVEKEGTSVTVSSDDGPK